MAFQGAFLDSDRDIYSEMVKIVQFRVHFITLSFW
jgi:hypothetical protein